MYTYYQEGKQNKQTNNNKKKHHETTPNYLIIKIKWFSKNVGYF